MRQNLHEPNRITCIDHSDLENRWRRFTNIGGYRLTQRMRAAGEDLEVGGSYAYVFVPVCIRKLLF